MKFRLLPTDEKFFELFQEGAANAALCARRLLELLDAPGDASLLQKVTDCEKQGDVITGAVLDRLHTSFVTPFDREDIHRLAEEYDDCVDDMLAVAQRLALTKVAAIPDELHQQAQLVVQMADEAAELMARLESMQGMEPHLAAIDRLESEGDQVFNLGMARLFSGEFDTLDVIRWKDLIEAMEAAMNAIEDISDVVEGIVLKHS
jgi:predicted phosphate transport protein (TIGR00153 family)